MDMLSRNPLGNLATLGCKAQYMPYTAPSAGEAGATYSSMNRFPSFGGVEAGNSNMSLGTSGTTAGSPLTTLTELNRLRRAIC